MWLGEESTETQQLFQPPADPSDLNLAAARSLAAELDVQLYGSTATIKRLILRRNPPLPLPPPRCHCDSKVSAASTQTAASGSGEEPEAARSLSTGTKKVKVTSFPYFCNWANFLPSPQLAWDLAQPNTR